MADILLIAFIFLIAGIVAVPIATKLGLGSVLGYLLAGIAISPLLNALNVDVIAIQHFAEFGVVMMLFIVGLELEPKILWSMRKQLIGLGGGQVIITSAALATVAILLGHTWQTAVTIGLILSLSSTAIVLQTLSERGLLKSDGGQASFSVLLTQDIAVIPMLAFIPLLALPELSQGISSAAQNSHSGLSLVADLESWQAAFVTLGMIALVIFGGNYLTAPLFRFVALARLRELFTATALLFVIGIALMMSLVGLSAALGTFLAGVVLANSPYKHELESNIEPFKGLLLGLFFITVGAGINFQLLTDNFMVTVLLTFALVITKTLVLFLLGRLFGLKGAASWLLALGLAQAGEFGFVLLAYSVANNVLDSSVADQLLLTVTLSMLISPALFIIYQRVIAPRYITEQGSREESFPDDSHVIIAGSGRMGGLVDRILQAGGYKTTVIDYNYKQLDALERVGIRNFFGDATRPDLLNAAGIENANLLIVALDDAEQITKLVRYAMHNYPHLHVVARAVDRHHVYDLWAYGCRDIIRETFDSTMRMGRSAFEALGIERGKAQEMVDIFTEFDKEMLRQAADAYEIGVPFEKNQAYIDCINKLFDEKEPQIKQQMREICERVATSENK
ncbi:MULTISPECIES: cation:proton antiporter [unclassified Pseudoalteromonas]|uniref:cation:proton antiporter domain-containing protein n=1 Tax=unclassified Pseudoalteromonas TaxID=194690 RepID=UPI001EF1253A|nr:cation:proton antiporter [Pseudoalteromonas sp. L21]MCF7518235.1 cation:proton antiporter [Pseudoalteromonas sp. L21]UJX27572.1 cation:proton antiporter [Pseudoalteromonas sp. CF6-2]|tara:strand:- start:19204 stop:21072 length:1869 start_codon:yes stop_codon:yes gene_type:complete